MQGSSANTIENIIVVMLENRSYDNVLGWLYNSNNQPPYQTPPSGQQNLNGLTGNEFNLDSNGSKITVANQLTPTQVDGSGFIWSATAIPIIDPNEPFADMAQQITGSKTKPTSNPYTTWPASCSTLMGGFVYNYESKSGSSNMQDVMNYFTPAQLPVTAWLANTFSVCDNWFASMPTQTFSNRVFGHCGAPGVTKALLTHDDYFSMADDAQYITDKRDFIQMPSVFEALDLDPPPSNDSNANWKLYFHDYSISIMTVPYVASTASNSGNINISTFDTTDWGASPPHQLSAIPSTFVEDLENGTLPPYSFIEPRYSNTYTKEHGGVKPSAAPNSNHPGAADYPPLKVSEDVPPIDVASGELLLMRIYNMLRNSSYWSKSLLIITYDENGGVYDHQAPPAATSPGTINWFNDGNTTPPIAPFTTLPAARNCEDPASDGFNYNVFGGRVPAIVVSPFVAPGSTVTSPDSTPFDHASLVRTVLDVFGQSAVSLTERDAAAPSVASSPNVSTSTCNLAGNFSGVLMAAPSSLAFHATLFSKMSQQLLQAGSGGTGLTATVSSSNSSWLTIESTTATENSFESITVTVSVDAHGLSIGNYSGTITLTDSTGCETNVPVALAVTS